jgi:hypothetical protein
MLRNKILESRSIQLRTHLVGNKYQKNHFFILNKGQNAGKPMRYFCPNCFVFFADSEEEKDYFFFLLHGIWELKLFRKCLVGSAIPYLRIVDLKDLIEETLNSVNVGDFNEVHDTLFQIETYKETIQLKLQKLMELRLAIFHQYLAKK